MQTNFIELMGGLFKDATPIQKLGFATFFTGKFLGLAAMVWVAGPVFGLWAGVPIGMGLKGQDIEKGPPIMTE